MNEIQIEEGGFETHLINVGDPITSAKVNPRPHQYKLRQLKTYFPYVDMLRIRQSYPPRAAVSVPIEHTNEFILSLESDNYRVGVVKTNYIE